MVDHIPPCGCDVRLLTPTYKHNYHERFKTGHISGSQDATQVSKLGPCPYTFVLTAPGRGTRNNGRTIEWAQRCVVRFVIANAARGCLTSMSLALTCLYHYIRQTQRTERERPNHVDTTGIKQRPTYEPHKRVQEGT